MKPYRHDLLGRLVEDEITRLRGVVVEESYAIDGTCSVRIQPRVTHDGKPAESTWISSDRVKRMPGDERIGFRPGRPRR
jgi:hypothetical protein